MNGYSTCQSSPKDGSSAEPQHFTYDTQHISTSSAIFEGQLNAKNTMMDGKVGNSSSGGINFNLFRFSCNNLHYVCCCVRFYCLLLPVASRSLSVEKLKHQIEFALSLYC